MRPMRVALALLVLTLAAGAVPAAEEEVFVVRAGHVWDGETVRENVDLVVRGGVFVDEAPPEGATVVDASEAWVTPGLVDAETSLGLTGPDSERTEEVTPRFSVAEVFDRTDRRLDRALAEGITAAWVSPGTDAVVAGLGAVIRAGPDGFSVAKPRAALELTVTDDPVSGNGNPHYRSPDSLYSRRPNTRMGVVWILRRALFRATGPEDDPDVDVVREAMKAGLPLRMTARREEDIRAACRIAREFDLRGFVVQDGIDAWRVAKELTERGARVVLPPPFYSERGVGPDATRIFLAGAAKLRAAGVSFALSSGRRGDGTGLREAAGFVRRFGLSREATLAAMTSGAADLIGIGDVTGRIAPGRRADLVVFSGDPLEAASRVERVIVAGRTLKGGGE